MRKYFFLYGKWFIFVFIRVADQNQFSKKMFFSTHFWMHVTMLALIELSPSYYIFYLIQNNFTRIWYTYHTLLIIKCIIPCRQQRSADIQFIEMFLNFFYFYFSLTPQNNIIYQFFMYFINISLTLVFCFRIGKKGDLNYIILARLYMRLS